MNECERCRELLPELLLGTASAQDSQFVREHLSGCPECRAEAAELRGVMGGLLHAAPQVAPPPELRARVLASVAATEPASRPPARRLSMLQVMLGLAAAVGVGLVVAALWPASPFASASLGRADVVVAAGPQVVVATSGTARDSLTIRSAGGHLTRVSLAQDRPGWYTGGAYEDGRAYLLDAANSRVVVLNMQRHKVEATLAAPGGAAGLSVRGGTIFVKTAASGEMLVFRGARPVSKVALCPPTQLPQDEVMDGVLALGGRLYATQHTVGEVYALSADGRALLNTYVVGGAPVGLASWAGHLLVLDVKGRLLQLDSGGQIARELRLPGTPDKLSIMHGSAYLTDRGGAVTVVDLARFAVIQRKTFGTPMDIAALPDGHLALADAKRGLLMLMPDLSPVPGAQSLKRAAVSSGLAWNTVRQLPVLGLLGH
ncbi:zf-HC2 domain-containing protein [Deinococcus sp.]|uniref:zf-HC2 domain-containing protein n=1 Tax=Deinococcus sp. TaxID=47478 RepID=UPI003CC538C8